MSELPGPFLLLHGGGGVPTMAPFAALLAERTGAQVLLPTHPGFAGTPRPAGLATVADLARHYVAELDRDDLSGVTVLGNSFGGWVAAELALLSSPRVARVVIVDGVGLEVEGHPVADLRGKRPEEIAALSWHDPSKRPVPPPGVPAPAPDLEALLAYTGTAMTDPTLATRLAAVDLPVHVIWGESDRIVDVEHGRAYAAAIPGAYLTVLPRSGHLPQLETPEELLDALAHDSSAG